MIEIIAIIAIITIQITINHGQKFQNKENGLLRRLLRLNGNNLRLL